MELREPAEVLDQIGKGELAVETIQRQVTLFVPNTIALQTDTRLAWIIVPELPKHEAHVEHAPKPHENTQV